MVTALEWVSGLLLSTGAGFYLAGTVGLLRFPDVYARLHALTKADNLGLGFLVLGLALQATSLAAALKILLIWPLVLAASAAVSYAIARSADRLGLEPWRGESDRP
ncbi:MAG: monovalent cation/H(+) antiporter subunit G [Thiobacillaceae bacterium]